MMDMRRRAVVAMSVVASVVISASPAAAHSVLRRGDVGLDILLWQKMLNQMTTGEHYVPEDVIAEDGVFGRETERATKRFERGALFKQDGVVAARERRLWMSAFMTGSGAMKPTMALGSYSTYVGHAQLDLNKWLRRTGRDPLMIDLLFGAATDRATRSYQAAHGLTVDGIIGPQTWGELHGWPERS